MEELIRGLKRLAKEESHKAIYLSYDVEYVKRCLENEEILREAIQTLQEQHMLLKFKESML